jgi:hypothetical protein
MRSMLSFENPNVMMAGRQGVYTIAKDVFLSLAGHRSPVFFRPLFSNGRNRSGNALPSGL